MKLKCNLEGNYSRADLVSIGCDHGFASVLKANGVDRYWKLPLHGRNFRPRGKRGGSRRTRKIRTVLSNRKVPSDNDRNLERREGHPPCRYLIKISVQTNLPAHKKSTAPLLQWPPSLYALNLNSLAKPHAREQLAADLMFYKSDFAIISVSKLKKHHRDEFLPIPGYQLLRRDRVGRIGGGVAIYAAAGYNITICQVANDNRTFELLWVKAVNEKGVAIIGALYHPPKPIYLVVDLYDYIERTLDEILSTNVDAEVSLCSDFNALSVSEITLRTGLIPLVTTPTRGEKLLDMIMTTPPQRHNIKVVTPTARTDHKAVLASLGVSSAHIKSSQKKVYKRRTPGQHAELLAHLGKFDDSPMMLATDPSKAWDMFYDTINVWLDQHYFLRTVTVTSSKPPYMTPDLKLLLRQKNRLMRRSRLEEASAISTKVGCAIARFNGRELRRLDKSKGTKELWRCVNNMTKTRDRMVSSLNVTAAELNSFYALTSTNPAYQEVSLKFTANPFQQTITEKQVLSILDHLQPTAEDYDRIPAWFLHLLAPVCSRCLAHLISLVIPWP